MKTEEYPLIGMMDAIERAIDLGYTPQQLIDFVTINAEAYDRERERTIQPEGAPDQDQGRRGIPRNQVEARLAS
jgi:hypothetical protein